MKSVYTQTLVIIFAIIIPHSLFASETRKDSTDKHKSKINIGLEYGPNYTHIVQYFYLIPAYEHIELNPTIRNSGGLSFQYNFNAVSSVHSNIFYERRWLEYDELGGKGYIIYNCFTLPLLYRITLNRAFFNAGAYVGYLKYGAVQFPGYSGHYRAYMANTKKFYKGVSVGAGYTILRNNLLSFSFELRDNFDLTNKDSFGFKNLVRLNTIDLLFSLAFKL